MLRNTIPFFIVFILVGLAALTWWRTSVPVFRFFSLKTNRRILKVGFIFGSMSLLASFGVGSIEEAARIGLVAVGATWIVDFILLEGRRKDWWE